MGSGRSAFYYFTGLENTAGAILAIDGRSRESWLFLPTHALYWKILPPEGSADSAAVRAAGIEHVADWSELEEFSHHSVRFATTGLLHWRRRRARRASPKHHRTAGVGAGRWYISSPMEMPSWVAMIGKRWPAFRLHRGQGSCLRAAGRAERIRVGEAPRSYRGDGAFSDRRHARSQARDIAAERGMGHGGRLLACRRTQRLLALGNVRTECHSSHLQCVSDTLRSPGPCDGIRRAGST